MATSIEDKTAQLVYPPNVLSNSSIANTKFLSACFSGAAAGILGLTHWTGFILFTVSTVLTATVICFANCKGKPGKYFQGGLLELVNPGQDNAFTFILVWTLFYGEFLEGRKSPLVRTAR